MGEGGGNNVCRNTSKWRVDIWNEMKYLVFHNNINIFLSDQFSLLIYLCLLPSSATVIDIGENMENARYAMNHDTAGFINQKKNRNTSAQTEYYPKLMKNYFASIYT